MSSVPLLSQVNPVPSLSQIRLTPSRAAGIPERTERLHRRLACQLAQTASRLLRLPQATAATAQVLIQRFYYLRSLTTFGPLDAAMGALFLATKVEETPKYLTDMISVFDYLEQAFHEKSFQPIEPYGELYYNLRGVMIEMEMVFLVSLGFHVHPQLPYGLLIHYLRLLGLESNQKATQHAWSFLNDALQTEVYALYQPPTLACMAIFLTARDLGIALPTSPPWWELFDVREEEMVSASGYLKSMYLESLDPSQLALTAKQIQERWSSVDVELDRKE